MNKLTEEDYDFGDVPGCELLACLFYEYMRESEAIIHEVNRVRQQFLGEMKRQNTKPGDHCRINVTLTKVTQYQGINFEAMIITTLAGRVEKFPHVPWQKLSSSDKQLLRDFPQRAAQVHNENFRAENPMLVLDTTLKDPLLGESTLDTWKAKRTPERYRKVSPPALGKFLVSGFFQINMSYTQPQLCMAFSDWLKANHPKGEEKPPERRGRNTHRDWLNALGALRLRYYCKTFTEAQTKMKLLRENTKSMFYEDRRSFNRACDAAVRHFRTLLELPAMSSSVHVSSDEPLFHFALYPMGLKTNLLTKTSNWILPRST